MPEEIRTEAIGVGIVPAGRREPMLRRTAWGAIFAGTFVAISCQLLLASLGLAIGAAAYGDDGTGGVGTFAGVWWILTAIISLFIGGMVTAWLAGFPRWVDGLIHGAVVWGLTVVVSAWLVTTGTAALAGGAMSTLQSTMSASDQSALGQLRQETAQTFTNRNYGTQIPSDVNWTLEGIIVDPENVTADDRRRATGVLVNEYNYSPREASRYVDLYVQNARGQVFGTDGGTLSNIGERAADVATNAATWTFFAILLGLGAAAFGGAIGRPQYLVDDRHHRQYPDRPTA